LSKGLKKRLAVRSGNLC